MIRERKIYDTAFKVKALELSNEDPTLQNWPENSVFELPCVTNGAKIMKNLVWQVFQAKEL